MRHGWTKIFRPSRLAGAGLAVLLAWGAGCAATPASRIASNQAFFDGLPVAAQARIRGGQIDIGFSPEMVRLALGAPTRRVLRHEAGEDAPREVWLYTAEDRRYEQQRVEIVDLEGTSLHRPATAMVTVLQEREVLGTRVEFRNGVVSAWESPAPGESR